MKKFRSRAGMTLLVSSLTLAAACSSVEPPREVLSQADLQVREAEELQASRHAPLELRNAREKLQSAQAAMRAEDYERARWLAEESLADAQLALEKSRSEKVQENVAALKKTIGTLKNELDQKVGK
jgi:DNA repair ATPase RecN